MKKIFTLLIGLTIAFNSIAQTNTFPSIGSAGIGTLSPSASSALDIVSTTQGVLVSRMTKTQRDAIASPATGLLIYQTNNTPGFYYYTGAAWTAVAAKGPTKNLNNLTAPTAVNVDLLPGTDNTTSLGSASLRWQNVNLYNLKFADGTTQSSAFEPYAEGDGISIAGTTISNTKPDLPVTLTAAGATTISGIYPNFTISSTDNNTTYSAGNGITIASNTISNSGDVNGSDDANLTLSNLSSTAVNQALLPNVSNSLDLGSSNYGWKDGYIGGSIYLDGTRFIDNGGTNNTFIGYTGNTANTGSNNTFLGKNAGLSNTSGNSNTANGSFALSLNTTGSYNTANGIQTLYSNITGSWSTADGNGALYSNTTGNYNTANGNYALFANTTGSQNTASGYFTLKSNTTANKNVALGNEALYSQSYSNGNTPWDANNVAVGYRALYSNQPTTFSNGNYNTAIGTQALNYNTTGYANSAFGGNSLFSNTTGHSNTALGYAALYSNTTGYTNTASGYQSLYYNTTGAQNSAFGASSLFSNTTGNYNSAFGFEALYFNTGQNNSAFGFESLYSNTTGFSNSAFGRGSLINNTTGYYNAASGTNALGSNTTGFENSAFGNGALEVNTTGAYNSGFGFNALYSNTTGSNNTALGMYSGDFNDANTNCTFVGYDADQSVTTDFSNSTAIGNGGRITASNQVRIGNSTVMSIGGQVSWTALSDGRYKKEVKDNVPGLEFINKLQPITYHLDVTGVRNFLGEDITGEEGRAGFMETTSEEKALIETGVKEKEQIVYTGFIAQDVEKAAQEVGYDFSGVDKPQNENSLYGLRYAEFVVPLVKAVQELDENQRSDVEKLKKEIEELKTRNAKLETQLNQILSSNTTTEDGFAKISFGHGEVFPLLGQNIPNPFDNSTLIPFRIPKNCNDASIIIAESATGKIVRVVPVSCGETQLSLDAGLLSSGTYSYSLYVDGTRTDTKSLVITK